MRLDQKYVAAVRNTVTYPLSPASTTASEVPVPAHLLLYAVPFRVRKPLHAPPARGPSPAPPHPLPPLPAPAPAAAGPLFSLLGGEGALPPRQAEVAVAVGVRDELEPQDDGGEEVGEAEDGGALGDPDGHHGDREAEEEVGPVQQQDRPLGSRARVCGWCLGVCVFLAETMAK